MTIMPALVAWVVIPWSRRALANINAGLLFLMAITSLEVYGVIIAGWASNSKYAFLGALRASAQMVSYEIAMGFCLVVVLMVSGSLNMTEIVLQQDRGYFAERGVNFLSWNWLPLLPIFFVYFISGLAETNRHPFDVVEGESRDRGRPHDRVLGHVLRHVLPGGVRQHVARLHPGGGDVPGRLAAPDRRAAAELDPGWIWLGIKTFIMVTMFLWIRSTFPATATTRSCAWAGRSSFR